jgi:hypothetical protein
MGLAALSDFHLAAAHGGSRHADGCASAPPRLFGHVADPNPNDCNPPRCEVILSTSSSLPALRISDVRHSIGSAGSSARRCRS